MRTVFDILGKLLIKGVLRHAGAVHTEDEILVNPRRIDLWFLPDPAAKQKPLGIFGRMFMDGPAIIEPYHQTPDLAEWRACVQKQVALQTREGFVYPRLWVISAGKPRSLIRDMWLRPLEGWPRGFYEGPPGYRARLVVVSELPRVRATLLLRLLGAGRTHEAAKAELAALPTTAVEWELAIGAFVAVRMNLAYAQTEEGVMVMEMYQDLYQKWESETLQRGKLEGKIEGKIEGKLEALQAALVSLYDARHGTVPARVAVAIERIDDLATLERLTRVFGVSSAAEIARALGLESATAARRR